MDKRFTGTVCAAIVGITATGAGAGTLSVPNEFTAGTAAVAADVNANFDAAETAVNDNDARVAALETQLSNAGRLFIAPKEIASLGATAESVLVQNGISLVYTVAFGRPADYVASGANDVTVRPLLSGCRGFNVDIQIDTWYLVAGSNPNNMAETASIVEFEMIDQVDWVGAPAALRTGLGDVNYMTLTRSPSANNPCDINTGLLLRGIVIEYSR